ncbi:hypothetical protein Maq22A_c18055 [Methylobacterium aquaticum]|uniref:Uncharacterized protein n=1 Tax=Methylobacterium aquaticum TaxID=270351 RepID=A0A0C6FUF3_9HYPH|nr:hypothetical protein Maq22A_c18055 [Methylobacterium aquaticum]
MAVATSKGVPTSLVDDLRRFDLPCQIAGGQTLAALLLILLKSPREPQISKPLRFSGCQVVGTAIQTPPDGL